MRDWNHAFGPTDPKFKQRVQRTLRTIEAKEEEQVKRKLSISFALAAVLCVSILAISALAAATITLEPTPDELSQPSQEPTAAIVASPTPMPTAIPDATAEVNPAESTPTPMPTLTPTPIPTPTPMPTSEAGVPFGLTTYGLYMDTQKTFHFMDTCNAFHDRDRFSYLPVTELPTGTPCANCLGKADANYYFDDAHAYYHSTACSGVSDEQPRALLDALQYGKLPCPLCILVPDNAGIYAGESYAYGSTDPGEDELYHFSATCNQENGSGDSATVAALTRLATGQMPCEICAGDSGGAYYATAESQYFHTLANCFELDDYPQFALYTDLLNTGKLPCPICVNREGARYYYTGDTALFHADYSCANSPEALMATTEMLLTLDHQPCPDCVGSAEEVYFGTDHGAFYHTISDCSGMQNARTLTLEEAIALEKQPCPACVKAPAEYPLSYPDSYEGAHIPYVVTWNRTRPTDETTASFTSVSDAAYEFTYWENAGEQAHLALPYMDIYLRSLMVGQFSLSAEFEYILHQGHEEHIAPETVKVDLLVNGEELSTFFRNMVPVTYAEGGNGYLLHHSYPLSPEALEGATLSLRVLGGPDQERVLPLTAAN